MVRWCFFFCFSFASPGVGLGGFALVEAAGGCAGLAGGARREAGTSTWAAPAISEVKGSRERRVGLTVLDAETLVNEAFVCQLGEQRRDHVCASVDNDERVDGTL